MSLTLKKILYKNETLSLALIVIVCFIFGMLNPAFLSVTNIFDLLKMCSYPAIFACGVMIVLVSGDIDMSFLWIGMFAAYSTSKMFSILQTGRGIQVSLAVVFLMSVAIGAVLGSFNALLVSKFRIPVFIATLSSANIFMGIMFRFIGSEYIFPEQMPKAMIDFSNVLIFKTTLQDGSEVGLHISVLVAVIVMILIHCIMKYTLPGRSVYAIGGDEASAERIGFNNEKVRLFIFMLAGAIAGLAGIIGVANIQVANPYDFQGRELTIVASVVIGGTSITGGRGSVIGVALGVLLTNIISQNLVLIGIQPEYNKLVFGVLVVIAASIQALQLKLKMKK